MTTPHKPGRYLEIEVSKARIDDQWAAISGSLVPASRGRWQRPVLAFAVAGVLAAILLVLRIERRPPNLQGPGAVLESVAGQTLTLADGSRIEVAAHSRLRMSMLEANHTELALERGAATFDVVHTDGRRFVVSVGAFDIVDVGTRFDVSVGADGSIDVVVERGRVQVQRRSSSEPPSYLGAGERWTTKGTGDPASPAASTPPVDVAPSSAPSVDSPESSTNAAMANAPSAKEIFESAERARHEGHSREAAAQLDNLRRHYRSDPRAGLASFELGRLRLDELSDPEGAAAAFQDAIVLAPSAPFREDAEARLVDAYDASGDQARCAHARDGYLARYPHGLYVSIVASHCSR